MPLAVMEAPAAQPSPGPWAAHLGGKFIAAPLVPSPEGEFAAITQGPVQYRATKPLQWKHKHLLTARFCCLHSHDSCPSS